MDKECCVNSCTKCPNLVDSRSQIVNGTGPLDSDILLVGEAPGKNEDKTGTPFIGKSGDLLDQELEKNDISRSEVRITNTIRCKPEDNRDPYTSEIANCSSYLKQEIESVNPDVVLTLGRIPTQEIMDSNVSVTKIAGETYDICYGNTNITLVPGIHPAATLYDRSYKEKFVDSVKVAIEEIK